jgi:energy-coupling factor transporter ATP-binding protein EcfA2
MQTTLDKPETTTSAEPVSTEPVIMLNRLVIEYPRMRRAIKYIDDCRHLSKEAQEPECMLIIGDSGVGKSTIKNHYLSMNPPKETQKGMSIPVLAVTTPIPAKMDSIAAAMLSALGDPLPNQGNLAAKTRRLYMLIKRCKVELVFLDEFQHFIDRDRGNVLHTVADWLKNFITETKVPVILMGLPRCQEVLESNEQLRRRFSSRLNILPFNWKATRRTEFKKFLSVLQDNLPIESRITFASDAVAERFWAATNGNISQILKIVKGAVFIAHSRASEKLEQEMLALAVEERLKLRGARGKITVPQDNPFHLEWRHVPKQQFTTPPRTKLIDSGADKAKTKRKLKEGLQQMF